MIENNFPGDYLVCDEHELTTLLLHSSDYPLLGTYASYPTKKMLEIVCGLVGVMLAECVNASYIKATYIVLTDNKLSALLAGLLTCGIVFPMITLSAEFGYNATRDMMDGILSFCMQVTKYIHGQSSSIQLNLPSAISPWASICTFGAVILIASRSYAASIQFNNDTFKQDLSDETLSILNQLTVVGSLLFNIYAINNISTDWLSQSLKHFGGENIKKKTEFYQFGQSILKDYKKMPQGLLCSGIETVLGLDIENDEVVSSSNLSFSPL